MAIDIDVERMFEIVLNRMREAEIDAHTFREKAGDREGYIRDLEKKADAIIDDRNRLSALAVRQQKDIEIAGRLYTAAEKAADGLLDLLKASALPTDVREAIGEIEDGLRKAVTASETLCPLPF